MSTAIKDKPANGPTATPEAAQASNPPAAAPKATPTPTPASPFALVQKFAEDVDRLLEGVLPTVATGRLATIFPKLGALEMKGAPMPWAPRIEVSQEPDKIIVSADLPGLTKDEVNVDVVPGMLTLHGERKQVTEKKDKGFYHCERTYGSFYRDIPLPEGAVADKATAGFKNGVLTVTIPVTARPGTKRLEVKET